MQRFCPFRRSLIYGVSSEEPATPPNGPANKPYVRRRIPRWVWHYGLRGVVSGGALASASLVVARLGTMAAPLPDRGLAAPSNVVMALLSSTAK